MNIPEGSHLQTRRRENLKSHSLYVRLSARHCIRALMMEAARMSETSVENYFTRQYIPEDKSELQARSYFASTTRGFRYIFFFETHINTKQIMSISDTNSPKVFLREEQGMFSLSKLLFSKLVCLPA
jgi:hypothetical protein